MEEQVTFPLTSREMVPSPPVAEETVRACPICSSEIRFFFINFNEKMLMCENTQCDFPFGYENLQFLRIDTEEAMSELVSVKTKPSATSPPSCSSLSAAAWSEIDKINRVYESEDSQIPESRYSLVPRSQRYIKNSITDSDLQIKKNVEDIKNLNMELHQIKGPHDILSNEKWINKLKTLQDSSGVKLLRPQELKRVEKEKTNELKIDIDMDKANNMSLINIKIAPNSNT